MLKNSNNLSVQDKISDLTERDLQIVKSYEDEGLPGIHAINDTSMYKMMDLYLSGKTYSQIARITRVEKRIVCYLSKKFGWHSMKMDYLTELDQTMRDGVVEAKIVSQDFLIQMSQFWQKKIGTKINKYLTTEDEAYANEVDPKDIDKYLKTIDMLLKFGSEKMTDGKAPAVGLNLGDGVTVKKVGNNEVEITPKQKTIGDMLKQFADYRREEENKSKQPIENIQEKKFNEEKKEENEDEFYG